MKKQSLLFFALLFCSGFVVAQSEEKAEEAFLKQLNATLINSKEYEWNHFMQEVEGVQFEKPFIIENGILFMTLIYQVGSGSYTTIKMEAPVNKITSVNYDYYLVLQFDGEEVTKQQYIPNSTTIETSTKQNYFHIGTPVKDGRKEREKLEKLLEKLLKYYKE